MRLRLSAGRLGKLPCDQQRGGRVEVPKQSHLDDIDRAFETLHDLIIKMTGTCAKPDCTANGSKRCAGCKRISYCSNSCQRQDWPHHKSACKNSTSPSTDQDRKVRTVKIHSRTDGGGRYSAVLTPREDPIFNTVPVPISQKIGFPLLVQRVEKGSARGPLGDNPHATWMMIDPDTGFAPAEWQNSVGSVIVARADGKALETETLGVITDYISNILGAFGNGQGAVQNYYNRERLDRFIANRLGR